MLDVRPNSHRFSSTSIPLFEAPLADETAHDIGVLSRVAVKGFTGPRPGEAVLPVERLCDLVGLADIQPDLLDTPYLAGFNKKLQKCRSDTVPSKGRSRADVVNVALGPG